jgi:hypothetical protein
MGVRAQAGVLQRRGLGGLGQRRLDRRACVRSGPRAAVWRQVGGEARGLAGGVTLRTARARQAFLFLLSTGRVLRAARIEVVSVDGEVVPRRGVVHREPSLRPDSRGLSVGGRALRGARLDGDQRLEQWQPVVRVVALLVGHDVVGGPSNMPLQLTAAGCVALLPRVCRPWWTTTGSLMSTGAVDVCWCGRS